MTPKSPVSPIPFDRSYWVVPGKLLAGYFPGSEKPELAEQQLRGLASCGVRHVVNLMEEHETNRSGQRFVSYAEPLAAYGTEAGAEIVCERFPVRDLNV